MPNNDLGTAHGRIRITYEERGSKKLEAQLAKTQAQMKEMEKRLQAAEKSLKANEASLNKAAKATEQVDRATQNYNSRLDSADKTTRKFDKDTQRLTAEIRRLANALENVNGSHAKASKSANAHSNQSAALAANQALVSRRLRETSQALQANERAIKQSADSTERATKAVRGYSLEVFGTHKRLRAFRNDTRNLIEDVNDLATAIRFLDRASSKVNNLFTFLDNVGRVDRAQKGTFFRSLIIGMAEFGEKSNSTLRIFRSNWDKFLSSPQTIAPLKKLEGKIIGTRSGVGLLAAAIVALRQKFLGFADVVNEAGGSVVKLDRSMRLLGFSAKSMRGISSLLKPFKDIETFAKSGTFNTIVRGSQNMAIHVDKFGEVSKRVFGRDLTFGFAKQLRDADAYAKNFFDRFASHATRASQRLTNRAGQFDEFRGFADTTIKGFALIQVSLKNLWQRFQWFFKLPKPLMAAMALGFSKVLPESLRVFSKALQVTSNVVSGLWGGIKQLSGAVLVLPGALAIVGAAVSSLLPVFGGLKDKLKDLFSDDPEKQFEALINLPDHLKPLGMAITDLIPKWKELQKNLQSIAFKGIEKQIKDLAGTYMPLFERGATGVVQAFVHAKNEVFKFAMQQQTQKDFVKLYENTASAIYHISDAIKPTLQGLRDMGIIASDFLRNQSVWAGSLSRRFAEWAQLNRNNGRLMMWMVNAKEGAFDLARGLKTAAQSVFQIMTIFKTSTGFNFLQSFSDQMDRFKQGIQKSSLTGGLANWRQTIQGFANNNDAKTRFEDFKDLTRSLGEAFRRLLPFLKSVSDSFSEIFIPMMEKAGFVVSQFLKLINELGASHLIGWILGVTGAIKLLPKVTATAYDSLKGLVGVFMIAKNSGTVFYKVGNAISAVGNRLEGMGGVFGKVGAGLNNIAQGGGGILKMASELTAGFAAVAAAAIGIGTSIYQGKQEVEHFKNALRDIDEQTAEFKKTLHDAFLADADYAGSNVLTTMNQHMVDFMNNLDTLQRETPSIGAHVGDFLQDSLGYFTKKLRPWDWGDLFKMPSAGDNPFVDDPTINKYQELGDNAKRARAELSLLVKEGTDLSSVMRLDAQSFDEWMNKAIASNKVSDTTAKILRDQKALYDEAARAAQALGPAGAMAAAGLDKIAKAAGNADQKLDGLREVLTALGFLQLDASEAAANFADAIDSLSEKVAEAIENGDGLGDIFKDGKLNVEGSKTARLLLPIFQNLSDSFLQAAVKGQDVSEMLAKIEAAVPALASQLGVGEDAIKRFLQNSAALGGPAGSVVKLLVQLDDHGLSETQKQFAMFLAQLQLQGKNFKFTLPGLGKEQIEALKNQANEIFGKDAFMVTDGTNITINPNIQFDPQMAERIKQWFLSKGFSVDGTPSPNPPTAIPALPGQPGGANLPPNFPFPTPANQPRGLPAPTIPGFPTVLPPELAPIDTPGAPNAPSGFVEQQQRIINEAGNAWTNLTPKISEALTNATKPIDTFVSDVNNRLGGDGANSPAYYAGSMFANQLGKGLIDQEQTLKGQAARVAGSIIGAFHQSPPKYGPLARHGDAAVYAGRQFGVSYAAGLRGGVGIAADAASGLGSAAISGTSAAGGGAGKAGSGAYGVGQMFGQISAFVNAFGTLFNAVSRISQAMLQFGKFISDPEGKGQFFGQSLGARFGYRRRAQVTDAQAAKNLEDRLFGIGMNAYANAQRAPLDPTGFVAPTGNLTRTSSADDIKAGIVQQGLAAGMTKEQIVTMLAVADIESKFDPTANGGIQAGPGQAGTEADRVLGLFQEKASFGTPEQRMDPNQAIARFIQRFKASIAQNPNAGLLAQAVLAQNPQLGANAPGSDYFNRVQRAVPQYLKDYDALEPRARLPLAPGGIAGIGSVSGTGNIPSKLNDTGSVKSKPGLQQLAAILTQMFPGIISIGGSRDTGTAPNTHDAGLALDIMVSNNNVANEQQAALGDQINAFLRQIGPAIGLKYTIWRNKGVPFGGGSPFTAEGHQNHIDVQFNTGAAFNPQALQFPTGFPGVVPQDAFGPPNVAGAPGASPRREDQKYKLNPDGTVTAIPTDVGGGRGAPIQTRETPQGLEVIDKATGKVIQTIPNNITSPVDVKNESGDILTVVQPGAKPGDMPFAAPPEPLNPRTGKPWTKAEVQEYQQGVPLYLNFGDLTPDQISKIPPGAYQTQDQLLASAGLGSQYRTGLTPGASSSQISSALQQMEVERQRQLALDTPESRATAKLIEDQQSEIMSMQGYEEAQNPFDTAMNTLSGVAGVATDVIQTIQSGLEAVGATKNIADTLVRGVENSESLYNMVDEVQKYITFAADIAQTTGSVMSAISSFVGAAGAGDTSGGTQAAAMALGAASQVAELISAALEATNAVIDFGQEIYRIAGTYIGPMLQTMFGGPNGALEGNVKLLLDERTNQLLAYSADNPLDKRPQTLAFQTANPAVRNQTIGQLNYYAGPGTDPRDDTRQMMFQVKAAQLTQATGP